MKGLDCTEILSSELEADGTNRRFDAEYYSKQFIANQAALRQTKLPLTSLAAITSKIDVGHVGPMADEYIEEGVPLLLTQNIGQFRVDYSNCIRVSKAFHAALHKSQIFPGDCLIARSGSIGNAALVIDVDPQPLNSADIIIVRADVNKVTNGFLAAFLNSPLGALQIERFTSGGVQGHINLKAIAHVIVPTPSRNFQRTIDKVVRDGMLQFHEANLIQAKGEVALAAALGLGNWQPPEPLTYTRRASEVFAARRLDSQYFTPRVAELLAHLGKGGRTVRDVAPPRQEKFAAVGTGNFRYIEISDVRNDGTATSETLPINEAPSRANSYVHVGDVLTSTVRPNRRLSALIMPEQDGCVVSSGFVVLMPQAVPAEVLLTYLRLPLFCELMDLHTSASLYPAISDKDLLALPFPAISAQTSTTIVAAVRTAHSSRQRAHVLLEAAKRAVEIAVEDSEAAALVYLKTKEPENANE